jgi:hypothetical protein
VWDYIFKTNYIPKDGRDIELGFNDENEFPHDFIKQEFIPKIIFYLSGTTLTSVYILVI